MQVQKMLANNLRATLDMLKQHVADLSDADLLARPVPAANHANWQLGHLASVEASACGALVLKVDAPADLKDHYTKETAKSDNAGKFLKKDQILRVLVATNAALSNWLEGLSDADLSRPTPAPFNQWIPTWGDISTGFATHTTMHVGQIQVLRRKLGKPVLF